jgi:hypothetical protein
MADVGEFLLSRIGALPSEGGHVQGSVRRQLVKLIAIAGEQQLYSMCQHLQHLTLLYDSVDYVEDMLKQQAFKPLQVVRDFDQFMRFHNQKLLGSKYAPLLSYSIRQKTDIIRMVSCRLKGPAEE